MTHITRAYRLGELHHFEAESHRFVYLVSAGAIFELDGPAEKLVNRLRDGAASHDELMGELVRVERLRLSSGVEDSLDYLGG